MEGVVEIGTTGKHMLKQLEQIAVGLLIQVDWWYKLHGFLVD